MENVKTIIFDLDGVLVDSKSIHEQTFIEAYLKYTGILIHTEFHKRFLCGLPTKEKLKFCQVENNLTEHIESYKQELTKKCISKLSFNKQLFDDLNKLKLEYKLCCASNSIRETVVSILTQLKILDIFDFVVSNSDVEKCKPDKEMHILCMQHTSSLPQEVLAIEDSPVGIKTIINSKVRGMIVKSVSEVNYENITNKINEYNHTNGGFWN